MERTAWTDERLSDLAKGMDAGFARVDADIRELRTEVRAGFDNAHKRSDERFDDVNRRFDEVNRRIDTQGSGLRAEIDALRQTILRVGGGMMLGLLGVIAAILAGGA